MLRRAKIALTMVALTLIVPSLSGDSGLRKKVQGEDSKKVSELMRKKLQHAQKVLEGIALNDFEKILEHADGLMQVSKEVEWKVVKTPRYEVQSNEFPAPWRRCKRERPRRTLTALPWAMSS
jgi:hypothetical protein